MDKHDWYYKALLRLKEAISICGKKPPNAEVATVRLRQPQTFGIIFLGEKMYFFPGERRIK